MPSNQHIDPTYLYVSWVREERGIQANPNFKHSVSIGAVYSVIVRAHPGTHTQTTHDICTMRPYGMHHVPHILAFAGSYTDTCTCTTTGRHHRHPCANAKLHKYCKPTEPPSSLALYLSLYLYIFGILASDDPERHKHSTPLSYAVENGQW